MRKSFFLLFFVAACSFRDTAELNLDVDRFQLKNGMTFLLAKRPGAPVFSGFIRIKVGNIEEPPGASGLAHFFEHMAFKGTPTIGIKDYEKEKGILEKLVRVGEEIVARRSQGEAEESLVSLKEELAGLQEKEEALVDPGELIRIYQRNGGSDINATTSNDFTSYFVSLPSSKLELWAYVESERLKNPVLREFFKERDVVAEERRMRTDNNPDGRLYETYLSTAFERSPYHNSVIGWPEDIQNYTPAVAQKFREKYYVPSRMVVAVVGDFNEWQAKKILRRTFGKIPEKENPPLPSFEEEMGGMPREKVILGEEADRFYLGFHRPAHPHPDDEILDVLQGLLCEGRTSRLFETLVKQKKMATAIDCYASLPGSRLPGLFSFYAVPLKPYSNKGVQEEILSELDRLKKEGPAPDELKKVERKLAADFVWAMKSNMGMAETLTYFESLTGDWRYLEEFQEKVAKITPEDVRRVVKTYFVPERMVVVSMEEDQNLK